MTTHDDVKLVNRGDAPRARSVLASLERNDEEER